MLRCSECNADASLSKHCELSACALHDTLERGSVCVCHACPCFILVDPMKRAGQEMHLERVRCVGCTNTGGLAYQLSATYCLSESLSFGTWSWCWSGSGRRRGICKSDQPPVLLCELCCVCKHVLGAANGKMLFSFMRYSFIPPLLFGQ